MSVAGGTEKTIGSFRTGASSRDAWGSRHASDPLTPDGKSITFSTSKSSSNLWLIEGLNGVKPP